MAVPDVDAVTIEGFRRGDSEAQRVVFERYRDRVYSIARYYLRGDAAAAEDVTQHVFVTAFRAAATFRANARLSTWLYRVVANACIDELRRRRRFTLFGDIPPTIEPAAPDSAPPDDASEIAAAVQRLSPKLRLAVLMRYFDDLSYDEMADALRVTPGTVASRLHRAHAILAYKLGHLRHRQTTKATSHATKS